MKSSLCSHFLLCNHSLSFTEIGFSIRESNFLLESKESLSATRDELSMNGNSKASTYKATIIISSVTKILFIYNSWYFHLFMIYVRCMYFCMSFWILLDLFVICNCTCISISYHSAVTYFWDLQHLGITRLNIIVVISCAYFFAEVALFT